MKEIEKRTEDLFNMYYDNIHVYSRLATFYAEQQSEKEEMRMNNEFLTRRTIFFNTIQVAYGLTDDEIALFRKTIEQLADRKRSAERMIDDE